LRGGLSTAQQERYINASSRYKPDSIRFLIVAESPPPSGGYFYFDFSTRHDYLFKETMNALGIIPETTDIDEGFDKAPFLRQFQSRGFFLIDVVNVPINELPKSEKVQVINDAIPGFVEEVKKLDPRWIIIVRASIFEKVRNSLIAHGLGDRILNTSAIPFPSGGRPAEFRKAFKALVAPVESGEDSPTGRRGIRRLESISASDDDDSIDLGPDSRSDERERTAQKTAETAVSQIEVALRRLVGTSLEGKYGSKWYIQGIPQNVKDDIEKNVKKDTSKYPYKAAELSSDPARFLEYTHIMQLADIIAWSPNWGTFAGVFRNAEEMRSRALQLQVFRNHVMHNRKMDEVVASDGKATILWFTKCMDCRQKY